MRKKKLLPLITLSVSRLTESALPAGLTSYTHEAAERVFGFEAHGFEYRHEVPWVNVTFTNLGSQTDTEYPIRRNGQDAFIVLTKAKSEEADPEHVIVYLTGFVSL